MTNVQHEAGEQTDPEGSIFLPKNRAIESFLALEGDPVALVAEIVANGGELELQRLKFSLMQSRGVERIGDDLDEDQVADAVDRRFYFYGALVAAQELLALDQAV